MVTICLPFLLGVFDKGNRETSCSTYFHIIVRLCHLTILFSMEVTTTSSKLALEYNHILHFILPLTSGNESSALTCSFVAAHF